MLLFVFLPGSRKALGACKYISLVAIFYILHALEICNTQRAAVFSVGALLFYFLKAQADNGTKLN